MRKLFKSILFSSLFMLGSLAQAAILSGPLRGTSQGTANISSAYGAIYLASGAVTQASISTTPVKALIFNANGLSSSATADHTSDQITVSSAGVYIAYANIISTSGTAGTINYHYQIRVNGSTTSITCQDTAFPRCTMSGLVNLAVNDAVSVYVAANTPGSNTIVTTDAQLYVASMGGSGGSGSSSGGSSGSGSVGSLYVTTPTANVQSLTNVFTKYTGFSTAGDSTNVTVSTITDRITVSTPGYYVAYVVMESSGSNIAPMECQIRINGNYVNVEGGRNVVPGSAISGNAQCSAVGAFSLSANDYLEVYVSLATGTAMSASHYHGQFVVASVGGGGSGSVSVSSGGADNLGNHIATMTLTTGFGILGSTAHFTAGITISSNSLTPGATARFMPSFFIIDGPNGPYSTALEITTNTVHRGYMQSDREMYIGPAFYPAMFDLQQIEIFGADYAEFNTRGGYTLGAGSGNGNTQYGYGAGSGLTSASNTTLIGLTAGDSLNAGSDNTIIGANADVIGSTRTGSMALGANAEVACDNCGVIGPDSTYYVGIGTDTPTYRLHVKGDVMVTSTFTVSGGTTIIRGVTNTWPTANASGVLTNNGSGSLSWSAASAGTPGGTSGQIQYNNAGSFAGGPYWDSTNNLIGIATNTPEAGVHQVSDTGYYLGSILQYQDSSPTDDIGITKIRIGPGAVLTDSATYGYQSQTSAGGNAAGFFWRDSNGSTFMKATPYVVNPAVRPAAIHISSYPANVGEMKGTATLNVYGDALIGSSYASGSDTAPADGLKVQGAAIVGSTLTVGSSNSGIGQSEYSLGLIVNSSTGGTVFSNFQVKGDTNASLIQTYASTDSVRLGTTTVSKSLTLESGLILNGSAGTLNQIPVSQGPNTTPKWITAASIFQPITEVSSLSYTVTSTDSFITASNGSSVTINLPPVSGLTGKIYTIKRLSAASTVTIEPDGAETIDGASNYVLNAQYESAMIICNGSTWYVMADYP